MFTKEEGWSWIMAIVYRLSLMVVGAIVLTFVVWYVFSVAHRSRRGWGMPPGPPTRLFSGNNYQTKNDPTPLFLKYYRYLPLYGPISSFKDGPISQIILQSGVLVRKLFDNKSAIYSDRPKSEFNRLLGGGYHLAHQRDPTIVRHSRRQIKQYFGNPKSTTEYTHLQEAESVQILWEFAAHWTTQIEEQKQQEKVNHSLQQISDYEIIDGSPSDGGQSFLREMVDEISQMAKPPRDGLLIHSFYRFTSSVLTGTTYGFRAPMYDHPACKGIEQLHIASSELKRPGILPPMDGYPIWKYLHYFAAWRIRTLDIYRQHAQAYKEFYLRAINQQNIDSFANKVHLSQSSHHLTEEESHFLCGIMLEGGIGVTAVSIVVCMMALVANPELQLIAQRDIDAVCNEDQLPLWTHRNDLQYIVMLIKETLRWGPPFPLGVAHSLTANDTCDGYSLPKGSTVIANIWAINRDPDRYPNPEVFDPERYRHDNTPMVDSMRQDPHLRDHFSFGAGRRACPGVQIAEQMMFMAISRVLWGFNLSVPPGYQLDLNQETGFLGSGLRIPKPFPLIATPRSDRRMRTVQVAMGEAERNVFSAYDS